MSSVPRLGDARPAKRFRPFGKQETAAAEIAEETNCLREKPCVLLIVPLLPAASWPQVNAAPSTAETQLTAARSHPDANHNPTDVRQSSNEIKNECGLPGE